MLYLPESFRQTITSYFHAEGAAWLDRLGELIQLYEDRWSIRVGQPFQLSFSYCAPAILPDGREAVIKLEMPNAESRHRAQALRHFNGHGMVRLIAADIEQGASLMERLIPGKMLAEEIADDEQATRIAAGVMQAMWIPAPSDYPFPTMADWLLNFKKIRSRLANATYPLPLRTIERTEALFTDLLASAGEQVLLHGDLHHFNILSVAEEGGLGWRAIDPFGVIGEREAEIGAFIRNPHLELPVVPALRAMLLRRIDIFQEVLGFDRQRLIAWAAVYAAVSAWWSISDGVDDWHLDAALADLFAAMLKTSSNFS